MEKKKTGSVYGIFNKKSNECLYVGSSTNFYNRRACHIHAAFHGYSSPLYEAIRRNADSARSFDEYFEFRVLEEFGDVQSVRDLREAEAKWMDKLSPKYNRNKTAVSEEYGLSHDGQLEYRKKNREKWNAYHLSWQHKNAEHWKAYSKAWRAKKKAEKLAKSRPSAN